MQKKKADDSYFRAYSTPKKWARVRITPLTDGERLAHVHPEDFIRIWQTSKKLSDVATRLKSPKYFVVIRAAYLRSYNIPLKRFYQGWTVEARKIGHFYSPEAFTKIYNKAATLKEARHLTGYRNLHSLSNRAYQLRKLGYKIKILPSGLSRRVDWEKLRAYALTFQAGKIADMETIRRRRKK